MRSLVLFFGVCVLLSGCQTPTFIQTKKYLGVFNVSSANVETDRIYRVKTGAVMFEIKELVVNRFDELRGVAKNSAVVKADVEEAEIKAGSNYPILGEYSVDGRSLLLIDIGGSLGLLVDRDGNISKKYLVYLSRSPSTGGYEHLKFTISPREVRIFPENVQIDYINHEKNSSEMHFIGVVNEKISFQMVERRKGIITSQKQVHIPHNNTTISIRENTIEILDADNEGITFKVYSK